MTKRLPTQRTRASELRATFALVSDSEVIQDLIKVDLLSHKLQIDSALVRVGRTIQPSWRRRFLTWRVNRANPLILSVRPERRSVVETILAMAPPISVGARLVVACFGFGIGCSLFRLINGRCPTFRRAIVYLSLTAILAFCLFMDTRGILAFVAGAICGTLSGSRPLHTLNLKKSKAHSWRLVAACIGAGPLLGVGLLGIFYIFEDISPLDRLSYLLVFLAVGSIAGLVGGGIVGFAIARSGHQAGQSAESEPSFELKTTAARTVTTQRLQRRVFQGLALGLIAALLWMIWLHWISENMPKFPTSLASGLTPWWQIRNLVSAAIVALVVFLMRWFVGEKPRLQ